MKPFLIIISLFTFAIVLGQKRQCSCAVDSLNTFTTINCKTTFLKNNSKLYWQFNCDKFWLTLENRNGGKKVINKVDLGGYYYVNRLGFHLIKEFDKSILFRSDCSSNGPCNYNLIDKITGNKIKEFGQLICIDADIKEKKYKFDFVVYFSKNNDKLKIYYLDSKKVLTVPFDVINNNLQCLIPEFQFDKMSLKGNILTLFYTNMNDKKMYLKINLTNKKYKW